MKAMRLLQSVAAALLQRFLSIRQKPFGGIEQYSTTAQIHPTAPHKVGWCSPIETAEDQVSDEVVLPCWTCGVFTLHY